MSFVTNATVLSVLEGMLKVTSGSTATIAPYWSSLVTVANTQAYGEILSAFALRGYTPTQVDEWDRGAEIQTDQALFFALEKGAGLHTFNDVLVKELDRREALKTLPLTDGGVVLNPLDTDGDEIEPVTNTPPGLVSHGAFSTDDDLFVFDPNDSRRGTVTRW